MRRMKNKLLHILALLIVSIITYFFFEITILPHDSKLKFFYGDSYVVELLLFVCISIFLCFKSTPLKTNQRHFFIVLVLLNMIFVSLPIFHCKLNLDIFRIVYFIIFFCLLIVIKKRIFFSVVSGYLIFCCAIILRLNTICFLFRDPKGIMVSLRNIEMGLSIFTLFLIASVIILFKRFSED